MKKQGTVIRWEDERGFGFIRSPQTAADIFFHIKDFSGGEHGAPRVGLAVTFEELHVGGKGPRAVAVVAGTGRATARQAQPASRPAHRARRPVPHPTRPAAVSGAWFALPLMAAYAAVLCWAVWQRHLPGWVLPASLLLNVATFFAYWLDKYAATQRRWRTPEVHLHAWALAGGWGGAWFAQQVLRHKTRKASFINTYWLAVVCHCGAVGVWVAKV